MTPSNQNLRCKLLHDDPCGAIIIGGRNVANAPVKTMCLEEPRWRSELICLRVRSTSSYLLCYLNVLVDWQTPNQESEHVLSFSVINIIIILSLKKNPQAIRLAEERRGLEQLTMSTAVNLSRAGQLSSHVYNVCSEAREAIYTSQEDAKHWLDKGQSSSRSMEVASSWGPWHHVNFLSLSFLWFCSLFLALLLSLARPLSLTLSLAWSSSVSHPLSLSLFFSLPIPPFFHSSLYLLS